MDSLSGAAAAHAQRNNIKRSVFCAILSRDFKEANVLLESDPPANREWLLRDFRIGGQPLLHFLVGKPVLMMSSSVGSTAEELDRLVRFCVEATGVNTEQLGNISGIITLGSHTTTKLEGCTALVSAIHGGNGALAESLARWGGATSVNFRDGQGRSATRMSIMMNDLKILKFLVEHGGADLRSTSEELAGANGIHPPLHSAIDSKMMRLDLKFHCRYATTTTQHFKSRNAVESRD